VREDQFDSGNSRDWDDKLTIESTAPGRVAHHPGNALARRHHRFLAGDSTVTDRDGGGDVSWGQMLSRFFQYDVAVANHAQSGETLKTSPMPCVSTKF